LAVKGASLKGGVLAGEQIPLLIDELPMLAALGRTAKRELRFAMRRNCALRRAIGSQRSRRICGAWAPAWKSGQMD